LPLINHFHFFWRDPSFILLSSFLKDNIHWRLVKAAFPGLHTEVREQTNERIYEDDDPGESLAQQIVEQLVHLRLEGKGHCLRVEDYDC
jgi:hypothetical protein